MSKQWAPSLTTPEHAGLENICVHSLTVAHSHVGGWRCQCVGSPAQASLAPADVKWVSVLCCVRAGYLACGWIILFVQYKHHRIRQAGFFSFAVLNIQKKMMISQSFFWCSFVGHIPAHNRDLPHVLLSLGWCARDSDLNLSMYKSRKGRERWRVPSSHHRWLIISVLLPSSSKHSKDSFLVTKWWLQAVLHLSNTLGKTQEDSLPLNPWKFIFTCLHWIKYYMYFKFIKWEILSEWELQAYGNGEISVIAAKTFQTWKS